MFRNHVYASCLGISAIALSFVPAHADTSQIFTGFSAASSYWDAYIGDVTALNKNLATDGFLFRASAGYGDYSYDRPGNANGGDDGDVTSLDMMVGYQKYFGDGMGLRGGRIALFVGGDYQDQSLSKPDPLNPIHGSEYGIKGLGELKFNLDNKTYVSTADSYSGAYDTYWSNTRFGYSLGTVSIGPEAVFLGNDAFDQQRIGVFLDDLHLTDSVGAGVSGGYSHASSRGDSGAYGGVSLTANF